MTKKDMTKLFKPFTRLETHGELNPNGVGLGLYICQKILQELNGFIKVKSTTEQEAKGSNNVEGKEKGTKFKFGIRVWQHELNSVVDDEAESLEYSRLNTNQISNQMNCFGNYSPKTNKTDPVGDSIYKRLPQIHSDRAVSRLEAKFNNRIGSLLQGLGHSGSGVNSEPDMSRFGAPSKKAGSSQQNKTIEKDQELPQLSQGFEITEEHKEKEVLITNPPIKKLSDMCSNPI